METFVRILLVGLAATAFADAWTLLRRRLLGVALPDYALVGRWVGHMARGRLRHAAIAVAPPIRGERAIGWCVHAAVGVAFAALVPLAFGAAWLRAPTPLPALAIGLATVSAPFLLMQPAMGAGVAASRTPRPNVARAHSVAMHAVFGAGLYLAALALAALPH
jgi:hypothetical protein